MTEDLARIASIATDMLEAGLTATADEDPHHNNPETLRQATILVLGTVIEATPRIATRRDLREASEQAGRETWYQSIALRERMDTGGERTWLRPRKTAADNGDTPEAGMDQESYQRCMGHLAAAEACMVKGADGWDLARLSHVIESLKERYGPRPWPLIPAVRSTQEP